MSLHTAWPRHGVAQGHAGAGGQAVAHGWTGARPLL